MGWFYVELLEACRKAQDPEFALWIWKCTFLSTVIYIILYLLSTMMHILLSYERWPAMDCPPTPQFALISC